MTGKDAEDDWSPDIRLAAVGKDPLPDGDAGGGVVAGATICCDVEVSSFKLIDP